jgi:hypothetical protein
MQTYTLQLRNKFRALSLSSEVHIKNSSYKVKCALSIFIEFPLSLMKT